MKVKRYRYIVYHDFQFSPHEGVQLSGFFPAPSLAKVNLPVVVGLPEQATRAILPDTVPAVIRLMHRLSLQRLQGRLASVLFSRCNSIRYRSITANKEAFT